MSGPEPQFRDRVRELRRIPAALLDPHPMNWRTHPPHQLAALGAALSEVGFAGEVLVREKPGGRWEVLDGHARRDLAAGAEVPCLVLDLDDEEAAKLLATYDPLGAMADADTERLRLLLAGIETESTTLRKMLKKLAENHDAVALSVESRLSDPERIPEPPIEPLTKPGDLWILGDQTLLCGDATKPEDLRRVLGGADASLIVTSPPYNCSLEYASYDDNKSTTEYLELIGRAINTASGMLRCGGFVAWNVGVTPKSRHLDHARLLEQAGLSFYRQIVWEKVAVALPIWKYTNGMARKYHPNYCHEVIYLFSKGAPLAGPPCDVDHEYSRDVWKIHQSAATRDLPGETDARRPPVREHGGFKKAAHPAAYPVKIPAGVIKHLSARGETVLDPFCGSGTTLIAAEQLGRMGKGIEIEPLYCDIAVRRWETFTGRKAIKRGLEAAKP